MTAGTLAVALHDIEPATFERCALIRDWLDDLGVQRITLLVIPAPDLHPFHERRPEMVDWLAERTAAGDAVAQHGFRHRRPSTPRRLVARLHGADAEFVGLDGDETRRAVRAGRRVLRLAGIQPRGFVAPAYAYTGPLRETLADDFEWWGGLGRLHRANRSALVAPALGLAGAGTVRRWASPALVRAGAVAAGDLLRLDLHPADLTHPPAVRALEQVLRRASRRTAVTYDDLL
jgi:predicted deacetylase